MWTVSFWQYALPSALHVRDIASAFGHVPAAADTAWCACCCCAQAGINLTKHLLQVPKTAPTKAKPAARHNKAATARTADADEADDTEVAAVNADDDDDVTALQVDKVQGEQQEDGERRLAAAFEAWIPTSTGSVSGGL